MRMSIILGALITEQEIQSVMPIEARAVHMLSNSECPEVDLWDIAQWYNSSHPKLMIDLHHREDRELSSSYVLAGLDWKDLPEELTKKEACAFVASEIKRLVGVDVVCDIMQIPECYCFYDHKKEE